MGGSESKDVSSRVTIEKKLEEESFNIVHVSENVVNRLRTGADRSGENRDFEQDNKQQSEDEALLWLKLQEERALTNRLRADLSQSQKEADNIREQIKREQSYQNIESSGLSFGQNAELERKMRHLSKQQEDLQNLMKQEFQNSVKRVSQKFFSAESETACSQLDSKVMQCYMDNPKQPLKCGNLAKDFIKCVKDCRAEMIARAA